MNKGNQVSDYRSKVRIDFLDDVLGFAPHTFGKVELTRELVERMLNNILIATPVQALIRSIKRKVWEIKTDDEAMKERFRNIENFDEAVDSIIEAMFYGYTVNEIIYNDDYSIKKLEEVPREMLSFDYVENKIRFITSMDIDVELPKFLVSYHRKNIKYYLGRSLLLPLLIPFLEYEELDNKIRNIQNKYGSLIPVFGYDKELGETKEGRELIKKQAESIKNLSETNVLAVPLREGHSLKDGFDWISLSDLKIDIHLSLRDKLESKVIRHLLGSTLTMEMINGGSFALGEIHAKEKEKAELEMTEFVKDELNKLIKCDNVLFGSDNKATYHYSDRLNEIERLKLNATVADLRTKTVSVLENIQNIGYSFTKEAIAEILEIPIDMLIETPIPKEKIKPTNIKIEGE